MLTVHELLGCMLATVFFAMLLGQPKETLVYSALIALAGYVTYALLGRGMLAFFLSGLVVGILCEIIARIKKKTTTLFLVSGIIPLVPGLGLYRAAILLAEKDYNGSLRTAIDAFGGIGAVALAITLSTALFSFVRVNQRSPNTPLKGDLHAPSDNQ